MGMIPNFQRKGNYMPNDVLKIVQAVDFTARKHVHQRRKGANQEPHFNHASEVARILGENTHGPDVDLIIAGLLHDTIEDTDTSYDELVENFGEVVGDLVQESTDDKSLLKQVRKQLQIEKAPKKSDRAKQLKIADKISNLSSLLHSPQLIGMKNVSWIMRNGPTMLWPGVKG
jgi:guanosine-3',5'-bis(diphosphate) 3'-pyrophosphohydrolase